MRDHLGKDIGDEATIRRLMRHDPMAVNQIMRQQNDIERYLEGVAEPKKEEDSLPIHSRYNGSDDFFKEVVEMPKRGDWYLTENEKGDRENEYEVQVWYGDEETPYFKQYSGCD